MTKCKHLDSEYIQRTLAKEYKEKKVHYGYEKAEDGTYSLGSCCGGGCWAVVGVTHCPFCGELIE